MKGMRKNCLLFRWYPFIPFIPVQKNMHDLKNILLAWLSAAPTFLAVDQGNVITIISAIILPTIFFLLGKAVDVGVQLYFRNRRERLIRGICAEPGLTEGFAADE